MLLFQGFFLGLSSTPTSPHKLSFGPELAARRAERTHPHPLSSLTSGIGVREDHPRIQKVALSECPGAFPPPCLRPRERRRSSPRVPRRGTAAVAAGPKTAAKPRWRVPAALWTGEHTARPVRPLGDGRKRVNCPRRCHSGSRVTAPAPPELMVVHVGWLGVIARNADRVRAKVGNA